jgi:glycosyltransferase involved in cell wall biosynthesis
VQTVSVIIPTYNRATRIERTLTSVLDQDYPKIEIIVVDDGSTDSTESVIKSVAGRNGDAGKQIRYIQQENQGACVARNRGMMLATGAYLMFLDSDDLIKRTKLSTQVSLIEGNNSQCSICDFECIDDTGKVVGYFSNNRHPHDFIREIASPSISTVLMRRDSILPGLQWNANLKRVQDIDFMYKYFASIQTWSYVGQALFQYCLHGAERISDSYRDGTPYSELRTSFKSYLANNAHFVATEPSQLYKTYARALLKHQLKNVVARHVPVYLKELAKAYRAANPERREP